DQMCFDVLPSRRHTAEQALAWSKQRTEWSKRREMRLKGYLGWLVTEARFVVEFQWMRERFSQSVKRPAQSLIAGLNPPSNSPDEWGDLEGGPIADTSAGSINQAVEFACRPGAGLQPPD